jgi:AcrR family transcriptional regulator
LAVASARARRPLSRERITTTAVAIVDAHGWEALSLRGVAAALDVTPMSLYRHVSGVDELVDLVVEEYLTRHEPVDLPTEWRALLRVLAVRTRELMLLHPAIYEAVCRRATITESGMVGFEQMLAAAERQDVDQADAVRAYGVVLVHVLGHVALEHGRRMTLAADGRSDEEERERVAAMIEGLDPQRFPRLRTAGAHVAGLLDDDGFFQGLDVILQAVTAGRS